MLKLELHPEPIYEKMWKQFILFQSMFYTIKKGREIHLINTLLFIGEKTFVLNLLLCLIQKFIKHMLIDLLTSTVVKALENLKLRHLKNRFELFQLWKAIQCYVIGPHNENATNYIPRIEKNIFCPGDFWLSGCLYDQKWKYVYCNLQLQQIMTGW